MAIANFHARSRLAIANAELARLRPENFRLQQWQASASGVPVHETYSSAYTTAPRAYTTDPGTYAAAPSASATDSAVQARWHPDPSGRHQLRYWDGSIWSDQVADNGVTSTDPAVD